MKPVITIFIIILIVGGVGFGWIYFKLDSARKECRAEANIIKEQALGEDGEVLDNGEGLTRQDVEKIFGDAYNKCLARTTLFK